MASTIRVTVSDFRPGYKGDDEFTLETDLESARRLVEMMADHIRSPRAYDLNRSKFESVGTHPLDRIHPGRVGYKVNVYSPMIASTPPNIRVSFVIEVLD